MPKSIAAKVSGPTVLRKASAPLLWSQRQATCPAHGPCIAAISLNSRSSGGNPKLLAKLSQTATAPFGLLDVSVATLVATVVIGAFGRLLARHYGAPAAIWVVPAVLPLLPGLQLVQAMLADTDAARISGLPVAALLEPGLTHDEILRRQQAAGAFGEGAEAEVRTRMLAGMDRSRPHRYQRRTPDGIE